MASGSERMRMGDVAVRAVYHRDMRNVYSPSEINREVRVHLESGFPQIWVEGEVSNLSRPASGHLYFSLKDDRAQLRCALFRNQARAAGFTPSDGLQIRARGRLSLYEPRGDYQLIVDAVEDAGEGRLRAAFEALKKRLEADGLFSPERKRPLPAWPARIAVLTSPSGAVIRDIIHVLGRRWPLARLRLYPVPVQGTEAAPAIVRALEAVNRHAWAEVVIVARGGGSLEDLWAFNEESVARAIHASHLPVVSAVGHETDFSISDFVADVRAPTPSAAAEMVAPDQSAVRRSLSTALRQLGLRIQGVLRRHAQGLDHLSHRLMQRHPGRRVAENAQRLVRLRARLDGAARRLTQQAEYRLRTLGSRLRRAGTRLVPDRQSRLAALARTMHAVSPLPTLQRGYAVVSDADTGRAITSHAQVRVGQTTITQLRDGRITSRVERTESGRPEGDD